MDSMTWRTSSHSGANGGQCTEVGTVPCAVLVRDSQDPGGPRLAFGRQAWEAFTAKIKAGPRSI
jgi:Domain of unknown function (DUF397)